MAPDVVAFRPVSGTVFEVRFADGVERRVDLAELVRPVGVFANLHAPGFVASGHVNADTGTIEWPGGGDVSPDRLYSAGECIKSGSAAA